MTAIAFIFLVVALVTGLLGFGGLVAAAALAQAMSFLFLAMFLALVIVGWTDRAP